MLRLTEKVYLTADKKRVVKENDADAAFLVGVKGALVSEADAKRFNLSTEEISKDMPVALVNRSQVVLLPTDPDDDSVYDDQSERGKRARADARGMVVDNAVDPPTQEEQQVENKALLGEVKETKEPVKKDK